MQYSNTKVYLNIGMKNVILNIFLKPHVLPFGDFLQVKSSHFNRNLCNWELWGRKISPQKFQIGFKFSQIFTLIN